MKKKILVADDDQAILEVITYMLEDAGYHVKTTVSGVTKKLARQYSPDLILLDIWMAGTDGRTICKSLKVEKLTMNIPVIMVSANRDTEEIAKAAGADDFLDKPFEMKLLLAKVAKYVGKVD